MPATGAGRVAPETLSAQDGLTMRHRRRRAVEAIPQTFVAVLFYLTALLACRWRIRRPHARLGPYMVVAFNHSSDIDIPLAVATMIPPHGWLIWPGRVHFIGRSD